MEIFKNDRCYSVKEIADKLGMSERSIYRLLADPTENVPSVRIRNAKRVKGSDLNEYLEKHKEEPIWQ